LSSTWTLTRRCLESHARGHQLTLTLLDELGLKVFLKTSGGKGMHLVVPLTRRAGWDEVKDFSHALVNHMAGLFPIVSAPCPGRRTGSGGSLSTICVTAKVPPPSPPTRRAREGLPVSVPIWREELSQLKGANQWNIGNLHTRLAQVEDPWAEMGKTRQSITLRMRKQLGIMMELTHFDSLLPLCSPFAGHRTQRFANRTDAGLAGRTARRAAVARPGLHAERWRVLARVAGCDLSLAKLMKAIPTPWRSSPNAVPQHAGNGIWGVWAAEPPDAGIVENGERVRLQGRKAWCSGALQIDRALLTAWEDDQPQLVAIELPHPSQRILAEAAVGRRHGRHSSSVIEFDDSPGLAIGSPGQYLSRPGFWQGGAGIAACWYGAAEALAGYLREQCRKPRRDPHADAHLGAVDAALYGACRPSRMRHLDRPSPSG
jgi:hypothetical protein